MLAWATHTSPVSSLTLHHTFNLWNKGLGTLPHMHILSQRIAFYYTQDTYVVLCVSTLALTLAVEGSVS